MYLYITHCLIVFLEGFFLFTVVNVAKKGDEERGGEGHNWLYTVIRFSTWNGIICLKYVYYNCAHTVLQLSRNEFCWEWMSVTNTFRHEFHINSSFHFLYINIQGLPLALSEADWCNVIINFENLFFLSTYSKSHST